ncbi:MAG: 8-oxo-dGTP pyrophosphatase MutT (NUDIX family), partial [Sulfitobacter sp.]
CERGGRPDEVLLVREFYSHPVYVVTGWSGEPKNLGDEHTSIRWFSASELQKAKVAFEKYPKLLQLHLRRSI